MEREPGGTPSAASPVAEAIGVRKSYTLSAETVEAVRGVDLSLGAGEFAALVGASGSGKTTLLNLLGCLDRPTGGVVRIMGSEVQALAERDLTKVRRRRIGFVFQDASLIPTLTALENVGLPLAFGGVRDGARDPLEALEKVGLRDRARRYPNELSGGERQRVAIARAIVHRPALLLADEPTGNLDQENGLRIFSLFRELVTTGGLAALVATHNTVLAALADRRLFMRDGRFVTGEAAR
jgi:putative ABC transport system ATP-binding protein